MYYVFSLNEFDCIIFLKSGTLNVKPYRNILFTHSDIIFIHWATKQVIIGPFHITNPKRGRYYGTNSRSSQVLCGIIEKIGMVPYRMSNSFERLNADTHKSIMESITDSFKTNFEESITGDLEIDGLLKNAIYNSSTNKFEIIFPSENKKMALFYSEKLKSVRINNHIVSRNKIIVDDSQICEKCIKITITEMMQNMPFISGYLASHIAPMRYKPGKNSPMELFQAIGVSDLCDKSLINYFIGTEIIIIENDYKNHMISPLSVYRHPFDIITSEFGIDNIKDVSTDNTLSASKYLEKFRFLAATIVLKNIFRFSGYIIDNNLEYEFCTIFSVKNSRTNANIIAVIELNKPTITEMLKLNVPVGSIIVVLKAKNITESFLKIIEYSKILSIICIDDFDQDESNHEFLNLENNPLIDLNDSITSELRHKITLIWGS